MRRGLIGALTTPDVGNVLEPGVPWALDNGCFSEKWNEDKWVRTLERHSSTPNCLFAVVPDVVCDSAATDERWKKYAPLVGSLRYRTAYVTQNGCKKVPDDADVVFTGGDNEWKMSPRAQQLAADRPSHMGRVNSLRRLRFAAAHGYDSVDGTFLAFGPDVNLPRLLRMLRNVEQQPVLS
jgi:hypothetical protein